MEKKSNGRRQRQTRDVQGATEILEFHSRPPVGELILEFPFPPEASQELIIEFPLPFPGAVVRINNKGGVLLVKTFSIQTPDKPPMWPDVKFEPLGLFLDIFGPLGAVSDVLEPF